MKDLVKLAREKDDADVLKEFRDEFLFPKSAAGTEVLYFAGNSLGLQPKSTRAFINQELDDWAKFGVEGHFHAKTPWWSYHESLCEMSARLVGAKNHEVVVMNSLSVNLHLMMATFYKPTKSRHKILIEGGAFPSDRYAVCSQLKWHGYSRESSLVELKPRPGEELLRPEDVLERIQREGESLALVLLGNVNYFTGQYYDIAAVSAAAHKVGAFVAFDLAHGAGNLHLNLHQEGPDFAAWCSYKYLNAGPGGVAGLFVHERHANNFSLPRLAGWWGHNKSTRLKNEDEFQPLSGAEGWQLSNPPIFQMAALRASLEIFDRAQMKRLRAKSDELTLFLEELLKDFPAIEVITPRNVKERGTQLSLRMKGQTRKLQESLAKQGVICDFRDPDVLRIAPAPLYTRFKT